MKDIRFWQEFGTLYIFTLNPYTGSEQWFPWVVKEIYGDGNVGWDGERIGESSRMFTDSKILEEASEKEKRNIMSGLLEDNR